MLALEITVNGTRLRTASTAGAGNVCCTIDAFGDELRLAKPQHGPAVISLGGLSNTPGTRRESMQWLAGYNCGVGDVITIRVVDVAEADADVPVREQLPPGIEKLLVPKLSLIDRAIARIVGWFVEGKRNAS